MPEFNKMWCIIFFIVFLLPGLDNYLHLLCLRSPLRVLHHPSPSQDLLDPEVRQRRQPERDVTRRRHRRRRRQQLHQSHAEEPAGSQVWPRLPRLLPHPLPSLHGCLQPRHDHLKRHGRNVNNQQPSQRTSWWLFKTLPSCLSSPFKRDWPKVAVALISLSTNLSMSCIKTIWWQGLHDLIWPSFFMEVYAT